MTHAEVFQQRVSLEQSAGAEVDLIERRLAKRIASLQSECAAIGHLCGKSVEPFCGTGLHCVICHVPMARTTA